MKLKHAFQNGLRFMKSSYNFIDLNVKDIQQNTGCNLDDGIKVIEILSERDYIDVTDKYIDDDYSYLLFQMNVNDDELWGDIKSILNNLK